MNVMNWWWITYNNSTNHHKRWPRSQYSSA